MTISVEMQKKDTMEEELVVAQLWLSCQSDFGLAVVTFVCLVFVFT